MAGLARRDQNPVDAAPEGKERGRRQFVEVVKTQSAEPGRRAVAVGRQHLSFVIGWRWIVVGERDCRLIGVGSIETKG